MEVSIITLTLITFMINPINKDNLIKSPTIKKLLDMVISIKNQRKKLTHSELLLIFINLRKNAKRITGRGSRGTTSYTVKEEEIYQEVRTLNKRGILLI